MVAGLWTELEVCSRLSDAYRTLPDECFLTNEGHRIFRSNRCYFNFGSEKARTYLMQRIASIYGMGVRYIKNDYNGHPGAGVDWPDASPAAGLEQHMRAVNAFYAEVRERFPGLYLENCSSGGMRADGNTNRNFHLQSVSDCEEFYKMPPLVCGAMLGLLPEQTGIWAYPYPRVFWDMNGEEYLTDAYREEQADGRNTAFNMINGMAGALYLSGKIDRADENNFRLIEEGVSLYKRLRPFLSEAVPFYPLPLRHIGEDTFHALGLRGGCRAVVAVWRTNAREDTVRIPLEGCTGVRVPVRSAARAFGAFCGGRGRRHVRGALRGGAAGSALRRQIKGGKHESKRQISVCVDRAGHRRLFAAGAVDRRFGAEHRAVCNAALDCKQNQGREYVVSYTFDKAVGAAGEDLSAQADKLIVNGTALSGVDGREHRRFRGRYAEHRGGVPRRGGGGRRTFARGGATAPTTSLPCSAGSADLRATSRRRRSSTVTETGRASARAYTAATTSPITVA